jgi:hypothetical protein
LQRAGRRCFDGIAAKRGLGDGPPRRSTNSRKTEQHLPIELIGYADRNPTTTCGTRRRTTAEGIRMSNHMHAMQMTGNLVVAREHVYSTGMCPIAVFHTGTPAGSWSRNDLTTRKPGNSRLTSALAP